MTNCEYVIVGHVVSLLFSVFIYVSVCVCACVLKKREILSDVNIAI